MTKTFNEETVASLELCRELYFASGWGGTDLVHRTKAHDPIPAYDAGYLLRKIDYPRLERDVYDRWLAKRHHKTKRGSLVGPDNVHGWGDTPEDALCRLAIDMFKQGVL